MLRSRGMPKALSVTAQPLTSSTGVSGSPPLRLHLAAGWVVAGVLNLVADFLPGLARKPGGVDELLAHSVDFGRHVGFGLGSMLVVWLFQRFVPAYAGLAWLALAALSVTLGSLFLPTDLDGLAERTAEVVGVGPALASGAVVLAISGAIPLLAWLTRQRAYDRHWLGIAVRVGSALGALAAFYCNVSVSPGSNPSAHLFLSWITAILAGNALPPFALPAPLVAKRLPLLLLCSALGLGSLWALFGRHSNTVMIRLARRPSSLHLLAVLHSDGGMDNVHATLAARAGPFFSPRAGLPPVAPSERRPPPITRPIVVLLSLDSMRGDLLNQPDRAASMPQLLELSQQGANFSTARAPGSMTKYTLGAISSGKYFSQQYWSGAKNKWPSEDKSVHLASVLSEAGVFTAAFPATDWLQNGHGVLRGFEHNQFEGERLPGRDSRWVDGKVLTGQLISLLESNREKPGFYWLHYLDTHYPYFRSGKGGSQFDRYLRSLHVVDSYVAEVRAAIGRLGLAERALIIVAADHGEAFGDHDSSFHGNSLYEELVRVPLLAVGPGVVARPIDVPVSLVDLGPTILDWFGLPAPASFMGQSLVPLLLGQSRHFTRPIVAETRLKQSMFFEDGYKAIRDLRRETLELYDLKADPGELNNLSDEIDAERDEHMLLLRSFFQVHTYRENGYRVPYVK
jgi:arylsulfatase A-like enzyme